MRVLIAWWRILMPLACPALLGASISKELEGKDLATYHGAGFWLCPINASSISGSINRVHMRRSRRIIPLLDRMVQAIQCQPPCLFSSHHFHEACLHINLPVGLIFVGSVSALLWSGAESWVAFHYQKDVLVNLCIEHSNNYVYVCMHIAGKD